MSKGRRFISIKKPHVFCSFLNGFSWAVIVYMITFSDQDYLIALILSFFQMQNKTQIPKAIYKTLPKFYYTYKPRFLLQCK